MSTRLSETLPGITLIACMGWGAYATLQVEGVFDPIDAPVLDGSWATAWEDRLDEGYAPREWGVIAWGVTEYTVFGDGRPGVLVGEDDWLFTLEEFETGAGTEAEIQRKVDQILSVQKQLDEQNIQLLVALLPAKARVYSDKIDLPPSVLPVYDEVRQDLLEAGVLAPDLVAGLTKGREQAEVFCSTDTHWTPWGAHIVALQLREALESWEPPPGASYTSEESEPFEVDGDLLRYIPLGPWQGTLGPGPEMVMGRSHAGAAGGGFGLLDEVTIPITVVGTSYTADERWGFEEELNAVFLADVLNAADQGMGPMEPMAAYLVNDAFTQTPPQLVIWEIPERHLAMEE
jgi:alginate O-acetyltransferase complex protein AlgJ